MSAETLEAGYWRAEVTSGRYKRPRIDLFLQHYLTLMKGDEVPATHLFADGNQTDILWQPAGGSREPLKTDNLQRFFVKMNGREVYKHAVRNMAASAKTALEANGFTSADVTWVIGHQANLRILEGVSERVGISMDRFFLNVDRYGNTSSASVPTALDEAIEQNKLREGDLLLFTALGGGLAWASAAVRW